MQLEMCDSMYVYICYEFESCISRHLTNYKTGLRYAGNLTQVHQHMQNLCYIAWSKQQQVLVSTWTLIKQTLYVLIKLLAEAVKYTDCIAA